MRHLAVVAVLVCGSALASARQVQTPARGQQPPQFRATTDLVLVDVSVIDRSRKPVRGLQESDFTLLEDGIPQQIATFTAIDLPDAEVPPAKWMSRTSLDVQTNDMPNGRLVLIYLDERQFSASPFATKSTTDTAHAIVDQLSPKDVAAVAFLLDHRGAQEFTADRGRLHAAIDSFSASAPVPVSVLGALRDVAMLLANIPERRKIVFYIGTGQSFDLEVLNVMDKMTSQVSASAELFRAQGQQSQFDSLKSLFRVAQRANVTFYTIDPSGLDGGPLNSASKEFLRLISNTTGGRAVIGNNAPATQTGPILAENASYYLMAFRSTNPRNEGQFRRVEVKVNRPNLEVRSRRGYVEGLGGSNVISSGANPALGRLIPATQLALGLWAAPAASDASGSHPVAVMVDVDIPRDGARPNEHLAVAWSIVDMSGRERGSGRQDLTVSPPAEPAEVYTATVQGIVNLPPGKYDIRLSAQLVERNRRGGLIGDVFVPDFAKEPLSAGGVFIGEITPGVAARGATSGQPLAQFLGVTPTTDRTFATAAPIVAAIRVFQTKQPITAVSVKATIVDARDKVVLEGTERLEPVAFATGFADYRYPMPFTKLATGQYLLRLEFSRPGAQAVKREVRFGVR